MTSSGRTMLLHDDHFTDLTDLLLSSNMTSNEKKIFLFCFSHWFSVMSCVTHQALMFSEETYKLVSCFFNAVTFLARLVSRVDAVGDAPLWSLLQIYRNSLLSYDSGFICVSSGPDLSVENTDGTSLLTVILLCTDI